MGGESNGERLMTSTSWSFVEAAARLLAHDEREAVLGDMVDGNENVWQGLLGVLGLVFRREAVVGKVAAMAGGIRNGPSKQLSPYGVLAVCQLELSDRTMPSFSRSRP